MNGPEQWRIWVRKVWKPGQIPGAGPLLCTQFHQLLGLYPQVIKSFLIPNFSFLCFIDTLITVLVIIRGRGWEMPGKQRAMWRGRQIFANAIDKLGVLGLVEEVDWGRGKGMGKGGQGFRWLETTCQGLKATSICHCCHFPRSCFAGFFCDVNLGLSFYLKSHFLFALFHPSPQEDPHGPCMDAFQQKPINI